MNFQKSENTNYNTDKFVYTCDPCSSQNPKRKVKGIKLANVGKQFNFPMYVRPCAP